MQKSCIMANKKEDKEEIEDKLSLFVTLNIDKKTKKELIQYCKENKIKLYVFIKKMWKQFKITGGDIEGTLERKMLQKFADLEMSDKDQEKYIFNPIRNEISRLRKIFEEHIGLVKFDGTKLDKLEDNNIENLKAQIQKLKSDNSLLLLENQSLKNGPQNDPQNNKFKSNKETEIMNKLLLLVGLLNFKDNNIKEYIYIPDTDPALNMKFVGKIHLSNYYNKCLEIFKDNDIIKLLNDFKKSDNYMKYINNAKQ